MWYKIYENKAKCYCCSNMPTSKQYPVYQVWPVIENIFSDLFGKQTRKSNFSVTTSPLELLTADNNCSRITYLNNAVSKNICVRKFYRLLEA